MTTNSDKAPLVFPFPYPRPWAMQQSFMSRLYQCIDQSHVGVFESPTGTGKSLSLLCGSLKWLFDQNGKSVEATLSLRVAARIAKIETQQGEETEPQWLRDLERKRIEREESFLLEHQAEKRKIKEERLKNLRREERLIGFARVKKTAKLATDSVKATCEMDFLVDEYDSDHETSFNKKLLDTTFDSDSDDGNLEDSEPFEELKIFYCSRTHSQLSQFVSELKKTEYVESVKSLSLGSRKNLCINDEVLRLSSVPRINDKCLDLQKNASKKCPFLPKDKQPMRNFTDSVHASVRDIEELAALGKSSGVCSYYGSRASISGSQIVTLPYNMMLQKSTRESLGIKLKGNIVIFDEAHNIIDTITSIYSVTLELRQIERAQFQLQSYHTKYANRLKGKNIVYIKQILSLLTALRHQLQEANETAADAKKLNPAPSSKSGFKSSSDFVNDLKVDHINLFKVSGYLETSKLALKVQGFNEKLHESDVKISKDEDAFVAKHVPALQQFQVFIQSLLNISLNGRIGIITSEDSQTSCFKYLLLSPTDVFQEIVTEARSVILAGGTMEPMSEFKSQLLEFVPPDKIDTFSCGHIVPPSSILTIAVPMGPAGRVLDFRYESRMKDATVRLLIVISVPNLKLKITGGKIQVSELGNTIASLVCVIPHGVVCFFVSYAYMDAVCAKWKASGVLARIESKKKVFFEPKESRGVDACLAQYSHAIADPNKGTLGGKKTGAILFCVVGGKMSEGINFSDNMARAVLMVGLPYPSKASPELLEKMAFIDSRAAASGITSNEYYENLCMRALNQSIGRAIRHKDDFAAIYLLDKRFQGPRVRAKLPGWIQAATVHDVDKFGSVVGMTAQFFKGKRERNDMSMPRLEFGKKVRTGFEPVTITV
ncbi:ATP-dependent DNA helicase chl1 [Podochytrium sp. JEL0797]|nr:ATP-dependent DNA helicase chl1 [Podochytrium sp. JEL0797]